MKQERWKKWRNSSFDLKDNQATVKISPSGDVLKEKCLDILAEGNQPRNGIKISRMLFHKGKPMGMFKGREDYQVGTGWSSSTLIDANNLV